MTRNRMCGLSLAAAILLPGIAGAQQLDSVVGSRGTPTFGTVAEMTRDQVTMETRQGKKQFAVNEIQKIMEANQPTFLQQALPFAGAAVGGLFGGLPGAQAGYSLGSAAQSFGG